MEQQLARAPVQAGAALRVLTAAAWLVTATAPGTMELGAAPFLGAWTAMMIAMMLPSAAPFLLLYRRGAGAADTALLGAGYLFVWSALGVAAYGEVRYGPTAPA